MEDAACPTKRAESSRCRVRTAGALISHILLFSILSSKYFGLYILFLGAVCKEILKARD
jgi:hypothetical protein